MHLTVQQLNDLVFENGLIAPSKAKKNDLINLLKSNPNISSNLLVLSKIHELSSRFDYEIYSLLMLTINFRAMSLYNLRRSEKIGVKKFKILYVFEEDKEFVDMALNINPNSLHPVFPSDASMRQPVIDL